MAEAEIQKDIITWLKASNILHWRVPVQGILRGKSRSRCPNPMTGHPDLAGVIEGRYFAIEVKTAEGHLSTGQIEWIDKLILSGAMVIIARSLDDVIRFFTKKKIDTNL